MLNTVCASFLGIFVLAAGGAGHEYDGVTLDKGKSGNVANKECTLSIFPSEIINHYSKRMLGYNYEWGSFNNLGLVSPVKDKAVGVMPENGNYIELMKGIDFPLSRMAGASSQAMLWKLAVGPLEERGKIRNLRYSAGPLEWIATTLKTDPKAEFVWVLNMLRDTPENARDLAEFFQGGADTAWGKKRMDYGLKQPVKIAVWELGNELDWGKDPLSVEEYIKRCREYIKAIRSVDPNAVFAASAATAPWSPKQKDKWKDWHQQVLKELAPELGFIAFHPYYWGHSPDLVFKYIDAIKKDISLSANKNIRIFCSEHAKWPPGGGSSSNRKNWFHTHSLQGCLDTADWITRCINRPEIAMMTYHCFSSGPWGLVYRDKKGRLYTTGIAEMFKLLGKIPNNANVLKNSCDDDNLAATVLSVGQTYYVLIDNRHNTEYKVKLNIDQSKYKLFTEASYTLSAKSAAATNSADDHPIEITEKVFPERQTCNSLNIRPYSMVLYKIIKK